jgi:hypothetical protein
VRRPTGLISGRTQSALLLARGNQAGVLVADLELTQRPTAILDIVDDAVAVLETALASAARGVFAAQQFELSGAVNALTPYSLSRVRCSRNRPF